jgi:hypothetical protein
MFRTVVALAGLVLASGVQAQGSNLPNSYATIGGGTSSYDIDCAGTSRCDNKGSLLRVTGGYRLWNGIGVEGIYANLGKATASVGTVDVEIRGSMVGLGVAFYLPLGASWDAAARVGAASVTTKTSGRVGSSPTVQVDNNRSVQPYAGLSVAYAFNSTLAAELSWDSTQVESLGDKGTVTSLALGLKFRF